jgi:hypothetical protein
VPPRDSLFSEKIVWSGEPATVAAPSIYRAGAWLLATTSAVSTLLAIAASRSAHLPPGRLLLFAAWCASFALAIRMVPVIWAQAARFVVTDRHVIWARGRFKRTIQRDTISYARIQWSRQNPGVGDLELVRAVPAGVLHRGLTLVLRGVTAPDRVWSIVRGVPTTSAGGDGRRPLSQRLDEGERVLWSGRPILSALAWLPLSGRRLLTTTIAVACFVAGWHTLATSAPIGRRLMAAGVPALSLTFLTLMAAFVLTVALLLAVGGGMLYLGVVRKPALDRSTRYLVTDQRVLIERGHGEIHLDRANIVDLVEERGLYGGRDIYLVMDGPRSRGYSASGAFGPGERARGFLPVLRAIDDVEGLRAALGQPSPRTTPLKESHPSAAGA